MRLLHPEHTNTVVTGIAKTGQVSKKGTVAQTEHWDGSMDATVAPAAIRLRITRDAPPDPARVAAFAELENAARRYRIARLSQDAGLLKSAQARLDVATIRLGNL